MNSFNSLDVQRFDVQNSKKERKKEKKKNAVYNYLEHVQNCKTF